MAYKSQVTNKYMGSSFAGRVNPGRENELTQLVETLSATDRALSNAVPKYKQKQVEKAEEQLEYLKSTMSPEELNAYILKGEDPLLSNKWAVSVVDGQVGRFQAGEVIGKIRREYGNYDFRNGDLRSFYKQYLPDLDSKSSAYKNGFAVTFNAWAADEYMKDADMRAKKATEDKFQSALQFLDNTVTNMDDYWSTVNSLNSQLPSTKGEENYFFATDELNELALQHATFIVQNATEVAHFDKAMQILTMDRGVGKNGQKLGSLINTKREDVGALVNSISNERFRFETRAIQKQEWEDKETIKNILVSTFVDLDLQDEAAIAASRKQIQLINPEMAATFDRLISLERVNAVSQAEKSAFLLSIANGDYDDDPARMIQDIETGQYPYDMITTALSVWTSTHGRILKSEEPIFITNSTYSRNVEMINNSLKKGFQQEGTGLLAENYNEAKRNATFYMESSILEFEAEGDKTNEERRQFMKELGDYVTNMFTNENIVNPDFAEFPNIRELGDEAAANNTNVNAVMRQMAQEIPTFDFAMTDDIALDNIDFDNMAAGVQQQLNDTVYPAIADEVIKRIPAFFQDNIMQVLDAMTTADVRNIAEAMGVEPRVLSEALGQYVRNNQ
tara:strand:- start:1005 stop:2861 length:1857 start_codon:yes stop_codon:yes gene_type:complete